jgi:uncharacterized repeat protein (TIGR04138 family)
MLDPSHPITQLLKEDRRYAFEAYVFVFEALGYAQNVLDMGTESPSEPASGRQQQSEEEQGTERHVSGQELCEAIRRFALEQYGYMAQTVLNSWGVHTTGDFGEIVFNLIRIGQMRKTAHDCREDFDDVYDFDTAFKHQFKITPPE